MGEIRKSENAKLVNDFMLDDIENISLENLYSELKKFSNLSTVSTFYLAVYFFIARNRQIHDKEILGAKKSAFFTHWVEAEFGFSHRRTNYYISLGEKLFSFNLLQEENRDVLYRLIDMGWSKAYVLLKQLSSLKEIRLMLDYAEANSYRKLLQAAQERIANVHFDIINGEQFLAGVEEEEKEEEKAITYEVKELPYSRNQKVIQEDKPKVLQEITIPEVKLKFKDLDSYKIFQNAIASVRLFTGETNFDEQVSLLCCHYLATMNPTKDGKEREEMLNVIIAGISKQYKVKLRIVKENK